MDSPRETWNEYQALVLSELKRLDKWARELTDKLNTVSTDLAVLKFKMVLIGAAAGMAVALISQFLFSFLGAPAK